MNAATAEFEVRHHCQRQSVLKTEKHLSSSVEPNDEHCTLTRSAKCADASQILWGYSGYTSLTMVVNGRNEEGGGGHQSNRELANTDQDQTTQLLFPTKTCSPTVPSEFRFSPALAHSFLYNPVQISPPSRFDEVSVSSTDSTKPNQIGQAVDLGTGYQERETTLEKSNP